MCKYLSVVVEDAIQSEIVKRTIEFSKNTFRIYQVLGFRGNAYIRKNIAAFNNASRIYPYLVVTDLDQIECAPILKEQWLPFETNTNFLFRVAVREAEAWLLADRQNLARFMSVSPNIIVREPELLENPKEYITNLAKGSRRRQIREDMVPIGSAQVGRNYNTRLIEFIHRFWDVETALNNSISFRKLVEAIESL